MRPDTAAPTLTPSMIGVTTDAPAKTCPQPAWASEVPMPYARKVNAAPRSTMPTSITVSGMCSATESAAQAGGKQTNSRTTTTIIQTWLASQMGAMARAMRSRCAPARGPRASRSHTPPPKSAPPVSV